MQAAGYATYAQAPRTSERVPRMPRSIRTGSSPNVYGIMTYLAYAWSRLPHNRRTATDLYMAAQECYAAARQGWANSYGERLLERWGDRLIPLADLVDERTAGRWCWSDDPAAIAWSIGYLRWERLEATGRVPGPSSLGEAKTFVEKQGELGRQILAQVKQQCDSGPAALAVNNLAARYISNSNPILHLIQCPDGRVYPGARGLCGLTATRIDHKGNRRLCPDCAAKGIGLIQQPRLL